MTESAVNPNVERLLKMIADGAEMISAVIVKCGSEMVVVESSQIADLRAEGHIPRGPMAGDATTCLKPCEQELPRAEHLLADVCKHGVVHLVLSDAVGKPFAVAQMPWVAFASMANGLAMDVYGNQAEAAATAEPMPHGATKH